ncbi:MAG: hypothetical protein AAGG44_06595, partial [Planctomycetota bacterium]
MSFTTPCRSVILLVAACIVTDSTASFCNGQLPVSRGRKLAPDAIEVIEPSAEWDETGLGPVDLPLVAANPGIDWQPNFAPKSGTLLEKAKEV